jgi:hypothetical protein
MRKDRRPFTPHLPHTRGAQRGEVQRKPLPPFPVRPSFPAEHPVARTLRDAQCRVPGVAARPGFCAARSCTHPAFDDVSRAGSIPSRAPWPVCRLRTCPQDRIRPGLAVLALPAGAHRSSFRKVSPPAGPHLCWLLHKFPADGATIMSLHDIQCPAAVVAKGNQPSAPGVENLILPDLPSCATIPVQDLKSTPPVVMERVPPRPFPQEDVAHAVPVVP